MNNMMVSVLINGAVKNCVDKFNFEISAQISLNEIYNVFILLYLHMQCVCGTVLCYAVQSYNLNLCNHSMLFQIHINITSSFFLFGVVVLLVSIR